MPESAKATRDDEELLHLKGLCLVCKKPLPPDAVGQRKVHEGECSTVHSKKRRCEETVIEAEQRRAARRPAPPLPDANDVAGLAHDAQGNLIARFPLCLICRRPVVPEPGALGKAREKKIHVGCEAERDRRIKNAFAPGSPATIATSSAAPAKTPQFKKQCTAVDKHTGRRCLILAPHDGHAHATERGPFYEVLGEGQTPRLVEQLTEAATARSDAPTLADVGGTAALRMPSKRKRGRPPKNPPEVA